MHHRPRVHAIISGNSSRPNAPPCHPSRRENLRLLSAAPDRSFRIADDPANSDKLLTLVLLNKHTDPNLGLLGHCDWRLDLRRWITVDAFGAFGSCRPSDDSHGPHHAVRRVPVAPHLPAFGRCGKTASRKRIGLARRSGHGIPGDSKEKPERLCLPNGRVGKVARSSFLTAPGENDTLPPYPPLPRLLLPRASAPS